ncbi:MAG: hypothetical protein ACNI26_06260 [Terasakiella sp.]|uniref:hypothetical protein n=1 Tax=unclassified Terasakiella TaxID=2614952 RepID=UPI003B000FEF
MTSASDVEITSATSFTITLSGADLVNVESILNKDGTTSATAGTTYNLAAADNWMAGAPATPDISDATNGITVSNFASPVIASATYDWSTSVLTLTGTNFVGAAGANNDIDVTKLTITGEGGATYTLTSSNVDVSSATTASVTLNAADKLAIHGLLNKNGTSSDGATTYNVAAADNWAAGAPAANNIADATTGITVSNYAAPTITSATYDYNSNTLVVTGTNFVSKSGANNDIDISMLTFTGEGGATYTLTSASDVEVTNATTFSVTLSGADIIGVENLLNKNGTTSATAGTTYNIAVADNWLAGGPASSDLADATGNGVTVSNYAVPAITSATYDWSNGQLVLTGTNFVSQAGATNDIDVTKLTITGEGGATYTLTSSNVDITSATSATVTLNAADKLAVHGLLNKNGTSSDGATTYNVAAAEDWAAGAPAGNTVADATTGITVSNYAAPTVTSATYDSDTGVLTVTGTNFVSKTGANNDIDISTLTFTGGTGNATYTLTSASDVEITSATSFSVTLSGADKTGVDALLDQIGTSSSGGSTYNIAAADNWLAGGPASSDIADAAGNAVTVSIAPKVTSATYDASTGALVVTGTNIQANGGGADIDASKLTITGEGGATYTLTDTADVERTSATSFTLTLSATDKAALNQIMNKNGTSSTGATTYNVALADDWNTNVTAGNTADLTGNAVTVSNVAVPTITSATYDIATNQLVVTGTNFLKRSGATNDIDVSKLTITGEGGATYTLTSASDVEITNGTTFTITLSAIDAAGVENLTSKNGTSADSGTTYNLAAAEDWAVGADSAVAVADLTGNGITVSNYTAPTLTSATYDYNSNTLVVTGTNFVSKSGATNDIDISKLTFTGEGGATYTLTSASDVEITSATSFTITLSGADLVNVESILNKDGTTSATAGTTYNLAAADNWMAGAPATPDISDATNGITVSNFASPVIASATYDWSTSVLTLTGTNFVGAAGANNDIDVTKLTITGEGGATYTLTSSNVDVSSATTASVTLNAADKLAIHGLLNKNGTSSDGATTYNVAAADNWAAGAPAANNIADATTGITVSNYAAPTITSATYDYNSNTLVVTGTNFVSKSGANNDIDISMLTFTGEGGATYTLTSASDVEVTNATTFSVTLSGADIIGVENLLNKNGTTSATSGTTYNIAVADNWLAGGPASSDLADATGNGVTVSNYAVPAITSATYDWSNGQLVLTGTNFVSQAGATNDIDVTKLTITGEGGATYTLTSSNVDITSATSATVTLNAADKLAVHGLLNKNGTSSDGATTYNVAAADNWAAGAPVANDVADATTGITVSNYAAPTVTSATYNSDTGVLTVTGTNFVSKTGANNDIDISTLTFTGGTGNATYTLTSASDVEITSATSFSVTLSGADKTGVDALLDQAGTSSAGGSTYNIGLADNWLAGGPASNNIADVAGNAVTVSINPKVTSATYDAATGSLVVTGSGIQAKTGAANDISANTITITGEGGATYTLTDTADVERTSATSFTLTLSATDKAALNQIMNKNGTSSTGATTYNVAFADDWNANVTAGNTADLTGNAVTVSNVAVPTITSATYDIATNQLVVTGTNFLKRSGATNDIDVSKLTITGEGGATYTLTSASDVEITNGTTFTITLSATDAAGVEALTSKNGTSAASGATYNLGAAEDWAVGADSAVTTVDATSGITVSGYNPPVITSATYDYATGTLTLTGTNFVSKTGAANDVDVSLLSLTGQGNTPYTLTDSADVEITSATSAVVTLSTTDRLAVNGLLNKDGTTSATGATTFNLAAADNWMTGAFASVDIVDATNGVTVSNYTAPAITSATYDITTKTLVVSGTNFVNKTGAANDVDISQLTLTGKGGAGSSYTLTSATDVEITSATEFTIVLNATDAAGVAALLDANGTTATDGATYNLAAAGSWLAQVPVDISDSTGNSITVSNVPPRSSGLNVSQIGGDEGSSEGSSGNEGNGNGNEGNGSGDTGAGNVNTPAGEVNFGNSGDRTTWNEVVNRGGSSSSVIDDPSAGVEGMTIVRNAVTGNDAALNSFYGTGRVSSANNGGGTGGRAAGGAGSLGSANPGLSGLAGSGGGLNGLANGGGGLGGGFGAGLGGGFGGSAGGDAGFGGVGDLGAPGNSAPAGGGQPSGDDEVAPGGEQASRTPQGGRVNFSAQLANAAGEKDLKVVKALLEAV